MPPTNPPKIRNSVRNGSTSASPGMSATKAFIIFAIANTVSALFAPIQDCDEVYNYWEPTHYLNHGFGKQTWEYSPEYAIRSWAYSAIHASIIAIGRLLVSFPTKGMEFYFLRIVLGLVCALCETRLYSAISRNLNPRVAIFFLIIMASSPGIFHSSTAYLPSSFAMYTTMAGITAFMDWQTGLKTAQGIFWFAVGALIGWPFAGALVVPFLVEEVIVAWISSDVLGSFQRILDGGIRSLLVLALQIGVDSFFYKKIVCVPLNIVLYNVFSGPGKGPNIYGTEPWHFYIKNLFLNFNIWFPLALAAGPLLLLHQFLQTPSVSTKNVFRNLVFVSPFYMWLGIFIIQPHKEERFMYPAYPALALNAALALHVILSYLGSSSPKSLPGMIPAPVKLAFISGFVLIAINLGVLRSLGMATGYSASLRATATLQIPGLVQPGAIVCLGKEWYRFPSSYFIPDGVRAKFIKSEFRGLLPGDFREDDVSLGHYPGTWLVPAGMNDENKEDVSKYTDISQCSYIVDTALDSQQPTTYEKDFISDTETWQILSCHKFLDSFSTSILPRLLWVPDWPMIPGRFRRKWGRYCVFVRRRHDQETI